MSTHPVEPVRRGHGLTRLESAMNRTKPAGGAASWLTPMIRLTALGYLGLFRSGPRPVGDRSHRRSSTDTDPTAGLGTGRPQRRRDALHHLRGLGAVPIRLRAP